MPNPTPGCHEGPNREEAKVLSQLREIPPGPIRDDLFELLADLVGFVRDPRCPEAQADGVPCLSGTVDCGQCMQVAGVLASLHSRLRRA